MIAHALAFKHVVLHAIWDKEHRIILGNDVALCFKFVTEGAPVEFFIARVKLGISSQCLFVVAHRFLIIFL